MELDNDNVYLVFMSLASLAVVIQREKHLPPGSWGLSCLPTQPQGTK
jgi:hypothetical protein